MRSAYGVYFVMHIMIVSYLSDCGIEMVPAGPGNPKGNGTDEGAFSSDLNPPPLVEDLKKVLPLRREIK